MLCEQHRPSHGLHYAEGAFVKEDVQDRRSLSINPQACIAARFHRLSRVPVEIVLLRLCVKCRFAGRCGTRSDHVAWRRRSSACRNF